MKVKQRVLVTVTAMTVFVVLSIVIFSFPKPAFFAGASVFWEETGDSGSRSWEETGVCKFTPASGITTGKTWSCDGELLANYIIALNTFFYRLAIVLAVLMITIGGFQWLIAMGNASKISAAKETIEQAVIGLALAFTAYLIFSQIDERFVKWGSLQIGPNEGDKNLNQECTAYSVYSCPAGKCAVYCPYSTADGKPVLKETEPNYVCDADKSNKKQMYCGNTDGSSVNPCKGRGQLCYDNPATLVNDTECCRKTKEGPMNDTRVSGACIGTNGPEIRPGVCYFGDEGDPCWYDFQCFGMCTGEDPSSGTPTPGKCKEY